MRMDKKYNIDDYNLIFNIMTMGKIKGIGSSFLGKIIHEIKKINKELSYEDAKALSNGKEFDKEIFDIWKCESKNHIEICNNIGSKIISMIDNDYPSNFLDMKKPPPIIFCRGNIDLLNTKIISVIGTRKPSDLGINISKRVCKYLYESGITICNGMAEGIDDSCININNEFINNFIGVSPSGINILEDKILSKSMTERSKKILSHGGLIITEYIPGIKESINTLTEYCRIQAGISDAALLIQSSLSGGSKYTISEIFDLSRSIYFIDPPEKYRYDEKFSANISLSDKGIIGLLDFINKKEIQKNKNIDIVPIKSKDDYDVILQFKKNNVKNKDLFG